MKQKLILFQPSQYNEIFSTYHKAKRYVNPNTRVNLPKISTNLVKDWETPASTSRTNNSTTTNNLYRDNKNFSSEKNSYIFDRNREIFYPILTQTKGSETSRVNEFLPYPSVTQHFKKIIDNKSKEKKRVEKSKNLKMIYLNLLNDENKKDYQISFLTESNQNEKLNIINDKITEINNNSKNKLNNIFCQTENSKIQNDVTMIKNIPIVLINLYAEEIYRKFYDNFKLKTNQKTKNNSVKNLIKPNIKQSHNNNINNSYVNNIFFKYVLDNVKHKIEIISENNQTISILYVKNLINSELRNLNEQLSNFKSQNYTENTSNNISKFSNNEIISRNTFKFKTNNSSTMKENENN